MLTFVQRCIALSDIPSVVRNFVCSSDGETLLCLQRHGIVLYDVRGDRAKMLCVVPTSRNVRYTNAVAYVPTSETFLVYSNEAMTLFEIHRRGHVLRSVPLPENVSHVCSNGRVIVTTNCCEVVHVFAYDTGAHLRAIEGIMCLDRFRDLCFVDADLVAVTNFSMDEVNILDVRSGAFVRAFSVPARPWHVCFDPTTRTLFVYCLNMNKDSRPSVWAIHIDTGRVVGRIDISRRCVLSNGMSFGGASVFMWNHSAASSLDVFTHTWNVSTRNAWLRVCI